MPLPYPERLAQHRDRPGYTYPPDERHTPLGQRQPLRRHLEARRQFLQPQAAPMLRRRQAPQPRVNVLRIDRLLQPRQLPPQVACPCEAPLEQRLLEPAIEVLDAAVELGLSFRNEHGTDPVAQTHSDHAAQGTGRWSPARQFARVVELDLLRPPQVLPALPE